LKACNDDNLAAQADDEAAAKPIPQKAKNTRKRSLPNKEDSSDEESKKVGLKKKAKPATKKAGGQRKADKKEQGKPIRAATVKKGLEKDAKKELEEEVELEVNKDVKKEVSLNDEGEVPDLSMIEAEDYFDGAEDNVSEYYDPDETEDDPNMAAEEDGDLQVANGNGVNLGVVHDDNENDKVYAEMLGISVEQYREYAEEAQWGEHNAPVSDLSPPTPGAHYSDEEEA
jgi:hypothetical protein